MFSVDNIMVLEARPLFPWIIFIATIPGSVITYLFAGLGAQICNYLPEKTETDKQN